MAYGYWPFRHHNEALYACTIIRPGTCDSIRMYSIFTDLLYRVKSGIVSMATIMSTHPAG